MDDFVAAWDIASSDYLPAFVLVSALFTLTGAGKRPVRIERLAATVRRPVAETRVLASSLGDLGTSRERAGASGPRHVDTSCRATGTPIRIELGPAGVAAVEPNTTVVAVVHPGRQPELMDTIDATIDRTTGPDEDSCYHQPFFAAPDAATERLATHPGGRLFTVTDFLEF